MVFRDVDVETFTKPLLGFIESTDYQPTLRETQIRR